MGPASRFAMTDQILRRRIAQVAGDSSKVLFTRHARMRTEADMYRYTESGLRNIWLVNGYVLKRTSYGKTVSIRDLEGLHRYIGSVIARQPGLSGPELRFLRKEMGMSQRALAEFVGTSEQNI